MCYNIYGVFENEELYAKAFGDEEKRKQFLKMEISNIMEKDIHKCSILVLCFQRPAISFLSSKNQEQICRCIALPRPPETLLKLEPTLLWDLTVVGWELNYKGGICAK
ncbi:hypothetical protein NC653_004872 [Populus alba x Populus x berolinensis]|uniref:Uncharacterized protein n=1 Tax=Populus alba x Populus x berolinensis TaxID=444605 RepID=A0AAD6RVF7_9ROSI|nr:hypothetical protein NC653_004872 [Populus alba x Populus x berolinensis]